MVPGVPACGATATSAGAGAGGGTTATGWGGGGLERIPIRYHISGVGEVVGAFVWGEALDEVAD